MKHNYKQSSSHATHERYYRKKDFCTPYGGLKNLSSLITPLQFFNSRNPIDRTPPPPPTSEMPETSTPCSNSHRASELQNPNGPTTLHRTLTSNALASFRATTCNSIGSADVPLVIQHRAACHPQHRRTLRLLFDVRRLIADSLTHGGTFGVLVTEGLDSVAA